jgi:hypothetical protein
MNAENCVKWMRRQGGRVIRTSSSYWCEAHTGVFQAFPYHWVIEPEESELMQVLVQNKGIALRYSTPVSAARGKLSYHVVCEDPSYDLADLPRQGRQNVRKGLRYADIEPIPLSRLASEGWDLRAETLARQGRAGAETQAWWQSLCLSAQDLPGFEAWGATHEGQLVAAFMAFTCDDCYVLPYFQSATHHLKSRVNNGIFYAVTKDVLGRSGISKVFAGLQSLDAPPSVDEFKFRIGYTPKPVRQRVVFHPLLAPLFNQFSYALVRRLCGWCPKNFALPKVAGVMRFYLEGKQSLDQQPWPERLVARKGELLKAI